MKYFPITLVLLCALSVTARAQELLSKAANADVLATVKQDVVLTSTGQTNFGTFGNTAHTETIDPKAPTAAQTTAMFTFSNPGGGPVGFTCPSTVTLTESVSSAVMTFTPVLSFSTSGPDQTTSLTPPLSGICSSGGGPGLTQAWFWLGGNLGVGSGQAVGSYSGVFTLTVLHQ